MQTSSGNMMRATDLIRASMPLQRNVTIQNRMPLCSSQNTQDTKQDKPENTAPQNELSPSMIPIVVPSQILPDPSAASAYREDTKSSLLSDETSRLKKEVKQIRQLNMPINNHLHETQTDAIPVGSQEAKEHQQECNLSGYPDEIMTNEQITAHASADQEIKPHAKNNLSECLLNSLSDETCKGNEEQRATTTNACDAIKMLSISPYMPELEGLDETDPYACGLLHYKKWWYLREVDVSVNGEVLTGIPMQIKKNTLRVINREDSYFIPMRNVDYIRTPDGFDMACKQCKQKPSHDACKCDSQDT